MVVIVVYGSAWALDDLLGRHKMLMVSLLGLFKFNSNWFMQKSEFMVHYMRLESFGYTKVKTPKYNSFNNHGSLSLLHMKEVQRHALWDEYDGFLVIRLCTMWLHPQIHLMIQSG